jgi:predicted ATP-dependent protease
MTTTLATTPILTTITTAQELSASQLRLTCDLKALKFETTNDLPPLLKIIGQPRALRALEMGSAIDGPGFNIFAVGLPDTGRSSLIEAFLRGRAEAEPAPDDWCYVNNFTDSHQPKALRLPAGRGKELSIDIQAVIIACARDIPDAFESDAYTQVRDQLIAELKRVQETEFGQLSEAAARQNFTLARAPFGFVLMPMHDGRPMTPEEVERLTADEITHLQTIEHELQGKVQETLNRVRDTAATIHERLEQLNAQIASFVIGPLMDKLKAKYAGAEHVVEHLDALKQDLIAHSHRFVDRQNGGEDQDAERSPKRGTKPTTLSGWLRRYAVNLFVSNADTRCAPVVVENHPTYYNLLGKIEQEVTMSGAHTDFTMIRPGALHRANGGYVILPARDVLLNAFAWDGLKHVLRDGHIRITEPTRDLSLISIASLEPAPIPLDVKVVLVGTPLLYYLLSAYDEDFSKLFKVKAEFTTLMARTPAAEEEYAWFVNSVVDQNHLPPFDRAAIGRIIEFGARLAGDQRKLSTRFGKISNLIREAAYWAGSDAQAVIGAQAVDKAIEEGTFRNNLLEERLHELINDGTLLVDVSGRAVGQINALSVLMLGDYAFGHPTRVTASARPGRGGVVDVERQAELGGPIHTKGVLIIEGYLGMKFGRNLPLALSASLAFEQSYEGVEGDSASAAELIALLSAVAGIPIRQDIAITGSVNQHGQIQAIGGVNEKIEGFFMACKLRGLTGEQGVLIPASNARHLMLRREVIEAVESGRFHVWTFRTIDEGLQVLTGVTPGEPHPDGTYSKGTFNQAVMERLTAFAAAIAKANRAEEPPAAHNGKHDRARGKKRTE